MRSFLILALFLSQSPFPLAERHRLWLDEEVHFLASSRERWLFLSLDSDSARDDFIESFWARRDPDPRSLENEGLTRHRALLKEADRLFTLVASRRGRFTDRGRTYQLLGPPASREDFTRAGNRLYPLELWQYTGVTVPFLPESFYLIFFREGGYGDFRTWSPTADGPQALVRSHQPGETLLHPERVYQDMKSIDVELAFAVERLVPGGAGDLPPFDAESLLSDLRSYADLDERYLRTKEGVSAVASFRVLGAAHRVAVLQDAFGMPQAHYALEVSPSTIAWSEQNGRRRASFALTCRLFDEKEREVNRWDDDLDIEIRASEQNEAPLSFQGRMALVPGRFRLDLSLSNTIGGGTYLASAPIAVQDESPGVSEIVLARSRRRLEGGELLDQLPFQLRDLVLSPSPDAVFPPREAVAYLQLWDVRSAPQVEWTLSRDGRAVWGETSAVAPSKEPWVRVEQVIPLEGLPEGMYTLDAVVSSTPSGSSGSGRRTIALRVDPASSLEAVRVLAREGFPAGHGRLRYERGVLFSRLGDSERAIEEMTAAAELLPRDLEIHLKLAFLLNARGRHQEVIDRLLPLLPHYPRERDLLVFLGLASLSLGRAKDAVRFYETALAQSPEDRDLQEALARAREDSRRH